MATTMTKYKAEKLLGLTGTYDYKAFTKAYRDAVKINHPDMGGSEDKMVDINAAKAYLETYFEDKSAAVTCSTTDFASDDTVSTENKVSTENADAVQDFVNAVYESMWKKDAPFYEGDDYTKKPQSEWSDGDWTAFRNFQPPISWKTASNYAREKVTKAWNAGNTMAEEGNIDVANWNESDWLYYWFTNARNPRNDNFVYTRLDVDPLWGPNAERAKAKREPGYGKKVKEYQEKNSHGWVDTPYGPVQTNDSDRFGWEWNVGIPFAYAAAGYEDWLAMNLEAQKDAKPVGPWVAENWGWTGGEFDKAQAKAAESKPFSTGIDDSWNEKQESRESAAEAVAGAVMGDSCKQSDIAGAPDWYNALNKFVNHFPSRILFWVIAGIWANALLMAGPSGEDYVVLIVLALLTLVNIVFPILAPVRGIIRFAINAALKGWAKGNGVEIDWNAVA